MPIDFQSLMASSPNAYVLLDRELRIVWMNEAYLAATMRTREDITGRRMFDAFPSDPASESHRLLDGSLQRVVESGQIDEIALIRYDIVTPLGEMETRFWSATHTPLVDGAGRTTHVLQHTVDVTELEDLRALRDEMGIVERASAVQARNLDLAAESEQMRLLFEQTPGFLAVLVGPQHEFRIANDAYARLVGQRDVIGKSVAQALPEIVGQGFVALLDEVRETGRPYIGKAERVRLDNDSEGQGEARFLDFIYQPIFDDGGAVTGVLVQGHDVTDQVEARDQQSLLINELNHRVKNTLAVIQGLASQSFRDVPGSGAARASFDQRLHALAAAHGILTEQNWKAARLVDTVRSSIEATVGSDIVRVAMSGPDIELAPQAAISTAMLIHELATNARKYGALSGRDGSVAIDWTLERQSDHCLLTIDWKETGGPPVTTPNRRGFGTRLIERGISTSLGSNVTMDFARTGLHCAIRVRLPLSD
ncbi:sensor histidine kinase [Novosphingobium sp. JCM 18896]|uniref:sensor histidine kinase n=1 Tax=Novosphingobium sp. JCM 18896 TaxID=2989731 RepID=UPI0022227127|nr:PAS domain-containing protein [Novosphingobium sp. JCM 18896]MCW1430202.1 PAS domain-containing protein [Novosphingobium sp. JCM 18896]